MMPSEVMETRLCICACSRWFDSSTKHITASDSEADEPRWDESGRWWSGGDHVHWSVCVCVFLIPAADLSNCDVELCEETYLGIWDSHSVRLPAGSHTHTHTAPQHNTTHTALLSSPLPPFPIFLISLSLAVLSYLCDVIDKHGPSGYS